MDVNGQSIEATADPNIGAAVSRQTGMSNADVGKDYNADVGQGRGLLNASSNYDSGLSYGSRAESDAIKARYMPKYNLQESELKLENVKNAQSDHIRNLSVATQAASQEVEINKQKALLKWKIDQQNKAARGHVLGQVLGITGAVVGGVAGAMAGGGIGAVPAAGAGYALGNAAGNAIGGA